MFFFGYKYQVGVDWVAYEEWYKLAHFSYEDINTEVGFKILLSLSNAVELDYYTFNFLVTSVALIVFFCFWKLYVGLFFIPFILFFYKGYGALLIDQTRQLIALTIALIAIKLYLKNKGHVYYIVGTIVAYFFHSSAAIIILMYLFSFIRVSKNTFLSFVLIGFFLGIFHIDLFNIIPTIIDSIGGQERVFGKIVRYMTRGDYAFFTIGLLEKFILLFIFFFSINKEEYNNSYIYRFFCNAGFLYFIISIYLFNYPTIQARISSYFYVGFIYIFCLNLKKFRYEKVALGFSAYFIFMSLLYMRNVEYIELITPYRNYIINHLIYNEKDPNRSNVENYWLKAETNVN